VRAAEIVARNHAVVDAFDRRFATCVHTTTSKLISLRSK
jgi:hypothetical protein